MKKSDIATIILIASISIVIAFIGANAIFKNVASEEVTVKTIEKISTEVVEPNELIFNEDAINPTVPVEIKVGSE